MDSGAEGGAFGGILNGRFDRAADGLSKKERAMLIDRLKETEIGNAAVKVARTSSGVQHFVWSTLPDCSTPTSVQRESRIAAANALCLSGFIGFADWAKLHSTPTNDRRS